MMLKPGAEGVRRERVGVALVVAVVVDGGVGVHVAVALHEGLHDAVGLLGELGVLDERVGAVDGGRGLHGVGVAEAGAAAVA